MTALHTNVAGKFIVLDGPDGCGKSTQAKLLAQWIEQQGVAIEMFRDPGGTAIGEKIRQVLLNPEHIAMSTTTELLLYMAARVQLWEEKIATALNANKCVVLDRWVASTCAYQGFAGGFGMEEIIKIASDCLDKVWPDLTIILDVNPDTAVQRLSSQPDRMEQKGSTYHKKVREGFLKLATEQKSFVVVDATAEIEAVHKKVLEAIQQANFK